MNKDSTEPLEGEDLGNMLDVAMETLSRSGIEGHRPGIVSIPDSETHESKVSFAPRTDHIIFRGSKRGDEVHIHEDTVKLLAKVLQGVESEFRYSSDNLRQFEESLKVLPDIWEVPFRDTEDCHILEDSPVIEERLGSELWERRKYSVDSLLEKMYEKVSDTDIHHESSVEPVRRLLGQIEEAADSYAEVMDIYGSEAYQELDDVIEGKRAISELDNLDEKVQEVSNLDEEETEKIISEIEDKREENEEYIQRLRQFKNIFDRSLDYEISSLLEEKEAEPDKKAIAYMVEPWVNGTIEDPMRENELKSYVDRIREEEDDETARYTRKLFDIYQKTDGETREDCFKQAVTAFYDAQDDEV